MGRPILLRKKNALPGCRQCVCRYIVIATIGYCVPSSHCSAKMAMLLAAFAAAACAEKKGPCVLAAHGPFGIHHSHQARLFVNRTFDRRLASLSETGGGGKILLFKPTDSRSANFYFKDQGTVFYSLFITALSRPPKPCLMI